MIKLLQFCCKEHPFIRLIDKTNLQQRIVLISTRILIQIMLYVSEHSRTSSMFSNNPQYNDLLFHKIYFSIRKRVRFGQGVYVCGNVPELGQWDPSKAYHLKWNEGDVWSGSVLLSFNAPETIDYKYIIADWSHPSQKNSEWEIGTHNRQLDIGSPKNTVACDDRWNMDRVCLTLFVPKAKSSNEQTYYVIGDIPQLGSWSEKKQMKKVNKRSIPSGKKQNFALIASQTSQQDIFTYTFYTYRAKQQFLYYYIKKTSIIESERKSGRIFKFQEQHVPQSHRIKVTHSKGQLCIIDYFSINELVFSQITNQIFVGSYPKSASDLQQLKQKRISAVFSIQSEKDFKRHGLSPHYLHLLCQQNGLKYKRYSILDMNNEDFVSRAAGGLNMMRELLKNGEKVYVHCSAGIYRSPQMIALYLTIFQKYSIEQAVAEIKSHHPFAKPSCKVIKDALSLINLCRSHSQILI